MAATLFQRIRSFQLFSDGDGNRFAVAFSEVAATRFCSLCFGSGGHGDLSGGVAIPISSDGGTSFDFSSSAEGEKLVCSVGDLDLTYVGFLAELLGISATLASFQVIEYVDGAGLMLLYDLDVDSRCVPEGRRLAATTS